MRLSTTVMPPSIEALPRNAVGYPIPWFVADIDGKRDFRVVSVDRMREALRFSLCFTCGKHMGVHGTFVIGPMCAINRISSEPPSHLACALYSAQVCPFLSNPSMVRRERGLPDERITPAGVPVMRNPGVVLAWTSKTWKADPREDGTLFNVGSPVSTAWFCEGRTAARQEVLASITSGMPALREAAARDGKGAILALERDTEAAMAYLPEENDEPA